MSLGKPLLLCIQGWRPRSLHSLSAALTVQKLPLTPSCQFCSSVCPLVLIFLLSAAGFLVTALQLWEVPSLTTPILCMR